MALTANEIRALRALRAGPLTHQQAVERWASGAAELCGLARAGLAEKVGEEFRITPAGRAACPPVNPLLAGTPAKPKEKVMLKNCNSYKDVVAAIVAAGPAGLTRKQLADEFAADSRADLSRIDAHVFYALTRVAPPAIAKLAPGHYTAAEFAPEPETVEEKLSAAIKRITTPPQADVPDLEVEKHARDYAEMIDFDIEAAQSLDLTAAPATTAAATPKIAVATPDVAPGNPVDRDEELIRQARTIIDLRAMVAEQQDKIAELLAREGTKLVVADVIIDDAETVEFAVYSSGGLDCITDGPLVSLSAAAFAKMRRFLGLFAEAA